MRSAMLGALILASLAIAACHTMRPVTLEELGAMRPGLVWVTRADQSVVVVSGPKTFGDTLVGYVNGEFEELPAADLKQIVVKQRARGKTAALIAGGAVGAAAVAYLVSNVGTSKNPCDNASSECDPSAP